MIGEVTASLPVDPPGDWLISFDGLVKLLSQLGVSPLVVGLIGLAFSLKSWWDAIKDGRLYAGRVSSSLRRGLASLAAAPLGVGFLVAAAVATAQLLILALSYVFGNFLSIQFQLLSSGDDIDSLDPAASYYERYRLVESALQDGGLIGVLSPGIYPALTLDPISLAVVCLGIGAIVVSYWQAARTRRVSVGTAFMAAFPVSAYFFMAGFGFIVTLFNYLVFGSGKNHSDPNPRVCGELISERLG